MCDDPGEHGPSRQVKTHALSNRCLRRQEDVRDARPGTDGKRTFPMTGE
jgi:hypothetical protein